MKAENNFKNLYDCLLESEDLFAMFAGMSGEWEKDKNKFIKAQQESEDTSKLINVFIIDEDELDDDI